MSDQFFHEIGRSFKTGFGQIQLITTKKIEGDTHIGSGIVSVPDSTTDKQIVIAWPAVASGLKSVVFIASADMTVEFNDGTTPDASLVLNAGFPYDWNASFSYDTCVCTVAVTALYLTNASGAAGNFIVDVVYDGTP